jgi:phosphatidylserine/phosphatidylglycerophosphate/cardiolipin synthase-like enzyme
MHHKYMIIDSDTVIQGSYNLSDNAEHNTMENMATFSGPNAKQLVAAYEANFASMWVTGEEEGLYGELIEELETAEDELPIIFDAMALDWDQVTKIKDVIYDRCPAINSDELRENPDRHYTCPL